MPRKILGTGGGTSFSSGGVTSGVIPKENGVGGLVDSALSDNGTVVTSTEQIQGANNTVVTAPTYSFAGNATTGVYNSTGQVRIASSGQIGGVFSNTGFFTGVSGITFDIGNSDTVLARDGAVGTLALKQSATTDALLRVYGANAGYWEHYSATELLTLSTGGTTTNTAANLLPANSIIHAVCCRITTTITTATNWSVGDSTTAARFSAANATLTSGTTSVGLDHMSGAVTTLAAGPSQAAAATVRITTTGTPGAGIIRIQVFASRFVPPTS